MRLEIFGDYQQYNIYVLAYLHSCSGGLGISNWFLLQENTNDMSEKEKKVLFLADMGYVVEEATIAVDRCGLYKQFPISIKW